MKYWQRIIKIPTMAFITSLLVIKICGIGSCYSQAASFDFNRKKEMLDFRLIKNLIVIPLNINGKGPFNFILDTGVGSLIVTDPNLLDTLNLKNLRTTKIYGLGEGQEIDAFLTNDIDVKIKGANIKNVPSAILKTDIFDLSNYLGVKIYGLIGYPFFKNFVVKINYMSNRLNFSLPKATSNIRGTKFSLEIENNRPYVFADLQTPLLTPAKVKLIIDCGASHALSMDGIQGNPFPLPKDTISANLGVGLSGVISGHMGRIPKFSLGKYKFNNILTSFPSENVSVKKIGNTQQDGNIGADILKRFNVVFDYQNLSMYLKPNQNFSNPFDHDMSGIEVYIDPNNKKNVFIGRIEKGSPAEKAGFLEQDEIVSINLKYIEQFTLEEIGKVFKSGDGMAVLVEIVRNNKNIIKLLKLKRRI